MAVRYQGKISDWDDDRGFGFVVPNGTGPRAFVHIKSFAGGRRRPVNGDLVTYELGSDDRGRPRAVNVTPVRMPGRARPSLLPGPGTWSLLLALLFLGFVFGNVLTGRLPALVLLVYAVASVVALLAYRLDKSAAHSDAWRISEDSLHMVALMGGWPGAMLAQRQLRHKTRKNSFQRRFWASVVINILLLVALLSPLGRDLLL